MRRRPSRDTRTPPPDTQCPTGRAAPRWRPGIGSVGVSCPAQRRTDGHRGPVGRSVSAAVGDDASRRSVQKLYCVVVVGASLIVCLSVCRAYPTPLALRFIDSIAAARRPYVVCAPLCVCVCVCPIHRPFVPCRPLQCVSISLLLHIRADGDGSMVAVYAFGVLRFQLL